MQSPSTHLDRDPEGMGWHNDKNVITILIHGLYLLVAEFLDSEPTLNEML